MFYAIAGTAIGLVGLILTVWSVYDANKQHEETITQGKESNASLSEAKTYLGMILKQREVNLYPNLSRKYPAGFALFGVIDTSIILPPVARTINNFVIDWKTAGVKWISDDILDIRFPDFECTDISVRVRASSTSMSISRDMGIPIIHSMNVGGCPVHVYFELIERYGESLVFVIGLVPKEERY